MSVESIRWHGDHLDLLDQRRLPEDIVYVTCRTAAETAAAIRDITGGEQMDTGEVGGIGQGEFDRLVCHGD